MGSINKLILGWAWAPEKVIFAHDRPSIVAEAGNRSSLFLLPSVQRTGTAPLNLRGQLDNSASLRIGRSSKTAGLSKVKSNRAE